MTTANTYKYEGNDYKHPGMEWIGQGRLILQQIKAVDPDAVKAAAQAYEIARTRWKKRVSTATLKAIEAHWDANMPALGCLVRRIHRTSTKIEIREIRLCASYLRGEEWDADAKEQGVSMVLIRLDVDKKGVVLDSYELIFIGLHAVVRWYQRNLDNDWSNLHHDLVDIFKQRQSVLESGVIQFSIKTRDGHWVGSKCLGTRYYGDNKTTDNTILRIQSFRTDIQ